MPGIKHLVECHCYLAIFKTSDGFVTNHKFPVYSKLDESGKVVEKFVKCNNCDTLHRVFDICRSDIVGGKDQSEVTISIEDISMMLPDRISNVLSKAECDIATWEHVLDIVDEERWGEISVIKRDILGEKQQVKFIEILSENKIKIKTETIEDIIVGG
jgi:hypothetical protein